MLKLLIDTNIFIPLEPTSICDVEPQTHLVNEFFRKVQKVGAEVYLLDKQKNDLDRDNDVNRKSLRLLATEKYLCLKNVNFADEIKNRFNFDSLNSHDQVDVSLLNALYVNAVSLLVTNDKGIHSKARVIGLDERVYRLEDAVDFINGQLPKELKTEPFNAIVTNEKCYNLDVHDDFFDSLRRDYKGFDGWFREKCQLEHRDCFLIRDGSKIAGLCIYKREEPAYEMNGNVVKICTFKLKYSGTKQGELLLRHLFKMCYDSDVDWLYVTAYESNYICQFFEDFGFECYKEKKQDTGELIYRRKMKPSTIDRNLPALPFHQRFGYRFFASSENAFLVPTEERFYNRLFPETTTLDLFGGDPCSNAIRKAYICNSNSRKLKPGNILFFYRTHSDKKIECCGILEKVLRSSNPDEILPLVGKRSVFSKQEIESMCSGSRECFLMLFRQTENLLVPYSLENLKRDNLVNGYPQTITQISDEAKKCILKNMLF